MQYGYERAEIEFERDWYKTALKTIATQDYRGPRPIEQVIAERALRGEDQYGRPR